MKPENFEECKRIMEQINNHEKTLEQLFSNRLTVIVNFDNMAGRITTIGIFSDSEHIHARLAQNFVQELRDDLTNRILYLKAKLDPL